MTHAELAETFQHYVKQLEAILNEKPPYQGTKPMTDEETNKNALEQIAKELGLSAKPLGIEALFGVTPQGDVEPIPAKKKPGPKPKVPTTEQVTKALASPSAMWNPKTVLQQEAWTKFGAAIAKEQELAAEWLAKQSQPDVVKSGQAAATVFVKNPDGTTSTKEELVGKQAAFSGPTCTVGVEAGMTINLGNMQFAKIGVTLSSPCAHGEIDDVYAFNKDWVNARMKQLKDDIDASK